MRCALSAMYWFAQEETRSDANGQELRWVTPPLKAAFEAATQSGSQRAYCIRASAINRSAYRPYSFQIYRSLFQSQAATLDSWALNSKKNRQHEHCLEDKNR